MNTDNRVLTVEEAAKLHIGFPHDPTIAISAWEKGFSEGANFGAAWQKEQDIEYTRNLEETLQALIEAVKNSNDFGWDRQLQLAVIASEKALELKKH